MIGALLNAFLWAMVVALAFNRWTWLEMRFNVGWILLGVWLVLVVALTVRAHRSLGLAFSLVNLVACSAMIVVLSGGVAQAAVIPACLMREGLMHPQWGIAATNVGMFAFVVACLAVLGVMERGRRHRMSSRLGKGR